MNTREREETGETDRQMEEGGEKRERDIDRDRDREREGERERESKRDVSWEYF